MGDAGGEGEFESGSERTVAVLEEHGTPSGREKLSCSLSNPRFSNFFFKKNPYIGQTHLWLFSK